MRNYFALFDFEVKFDINLDLLEKKYLELQVKYHPDNSALDTPKKKIELIDKTGEINQAYQTIKDNLGRAIHMLVLQDINFKDYRLEKNDLQEIWDECDLVDGMDNKNVLQTKLIQKLDYKKNIISKLSKAFEANDYNLANYYTVILKYSENLISCLKQKCES